MTVGHIPNARHGSDYRVKSEPALHRIRATLAAWSCWCGGKYPTGGGPPEKAARGERQRA